MNPYSNDSDTAIKALRHIAASKPVDDTTKHACRFAAGHIEKLNAALLEAHRTERKAVLAIVLRFVHSSTMLRLEKKVDEDAEKRGAR